ncbi:DUF4124 domain-containing protein [Parahaliea mediterranea]|uniref:DUF4124 domain-containing protein n=1 Tax=Parahaliea mediterranea TaxID=651086 RepID=A0A939IP85_9GAMM|nr:DUF4124 domain-containing protein [Parahaliea mediterranea]MBN7798797.1 DUF4124 domain-containing protein [Parahaliea mediterranea]
MNIRLLLLALITATTTAQAAPATVYKTVDDRGHVTFSDTPPEDGAATETLQIHTPEPLTDAASRQRLDNMRATTDRMAADRRQREQHRAQLREEARKASQVADRAPVDRYYSELYNPGYYPYPVYHPRRHHHSRSRPDIRPPLRGGALHRNAQLMRPILPRD